MRDALRSFLVRLATDAARLSAFLTDPRAEMERAGLEAQTQETLLSGDQLRLDRALLALGAETGSGTGGARGGDAAQTRAKPGGSNGQGSPPQHYWFVPGSNPAVAPWQAASGEQLPTPPVGLPAINETEGQAAEAMFDDQLVVVGTGIRTVGQLTIEALAWIQKADKVLYIVADPIAEAVIQELNPEGAESLAHLYATDKHRMQTYEEMIGITLDYVRRGLTVCLAAYGHPGVFAYPPHQVVHRARAEGFRARMLPGISAEDCLFADLGMDPATAGCQTFEATDFLINDRIIDPSSNVVLWQIGTLGVATYRRGLYELRGMPQLLQKLYRHYWPQHPVVVYEAAISPGVRPVILTVPLYLLPSMPLRPATTLFIPAATAPRTDVGMVEAMGLAHR